MESNGIHEYENESSFETLIDKNNCAMPKATIMAGRVWLTTSNKERCRLKR